MGVILGLVSAVCYGTSDFFGGWATRKHRLLPALLLIQLLSLCGALLLLTLDHPTPVPWADVGKGLLAGSCGVLGLALLFAGMARGAVGVVAPLSAVGASLVPLAYGLSRGEHPGALVLSGVVVAMVGIALISYEPGVLGRRGSVAAEAAFGAGAGLGFGGSLTTFSTVSHDAGLWPLLSSRLGPVVLVGAAAALRRVRPVSAQTPWPQVLVAAASDLGATALQLLAFRQGLTSVVAPVAALFPVFTVLLARLIFHEYLSGPRLAGLVLSVAGLVLIAS